MSVSLTGRSNVQQDFDLGNRVRLIAQINPYMAKNIGALEAMASLPIGTEDLARNASGMYAMTMGDGMAGQLEGMSPGTQRAVWSTLPAAQQMALTNLGYSPPDDNRDSWFDTAVGPLDEIAGGVLGAFNKAAVAVGSPVFHGLTWVADRPTHLYRTIRTMDQRNQLQAAALATVGVGLALASRGKNTGTLRTAARLGFAGLGAGAVGAGITDPMDFANAFRASYRGEMTFKASARRRADELLGDPRIITLAESVADADISTEELAYELAGERNASPNGELAKLEAIVSRYAEKGTAGYEEAFKMLYETTQDPSFRDAVQELRNGKISPGRDVADIFFDPGETGYSLLSGMVDAAWQVTMDPTLLATDVLSLRKAKAVGMNGMSGTEAARRFVEVQDANAGVRRLHQYAAKAVDLDDWEMMKRMAPEFAPLYIPMQEYKNALATAGQLGEDGFDLATFNQYIIEATHLAPLAQGIGTVKAADGVLLKGMSRGGERWRSLVAEFRDSTANMYDGNFEEQIAMRLREQLRGGANDGPLAIDQMESDELLRAAMPASLYGEVTASGELVMPWHKGYGSRSERISRTLGRTWIGSSIGESLTAITTQIPQGRAIAMVEDAALGLSASQDIPAVVALGRYLGMPSYVAKHWESLIMNAKNPADRIRLMNGWLDNALTMSGAKAHAEGREIVEKILQRQRQAYAGGGLDVELIDGIPQALTLLPSHAAKKVVMPNLHELRKAARAGHMVDFLGVADLPVIDTMMNKIWKPAVLLRFAFIPRAFGEEGLNFMLRGGLGSMGMEMGARSIGRRDVYRAAADVERVLPLTPLEEQLVAGGWTNLLPAHARQFGKGMDRYKRWAQTVDESDSPLVRMMARYGWTDPMQSKLIDYSTWLDKQLREGGSVAKSLGGKTERGIDRLAGAFPETVMVPGRKGTVRRVSARENVTNNLNSLAFGNPDSWRRMRIGGVHDRMIAASREYYALHARAVMGEVSAVNAGPFDIGHDRQTATKTTPFLQDGVVTTQELVISRGHFQRIVDTDRRFLNAIHEGVASIAYDPAVQRVLAAEVIRIKGTTVAMADADIADVVHGYQHAVNTDLSLKLVAAELAGGAPSAENFTAMLHNLASMDMPAINGATLAERLREVVPSGRMVAWADVEPVLTQWGKMMADVAKRQAYLDGVKSLGSVIERVEQLPLVDRRFIGPLLRSQETGYAVRADDIRASLPQAPQEIVPRPPAQIDLDRMGQPGKPKVYTDKDKAKASRASKFIGRGSENSSTNRYADVFGDFANSGMYDQTDTVFISAEGARKGRVEPDYDEIDKALEARATIITDVEADRMRTYNIGERNVAKHLGSRRYAEVEPGIWKPVDAISGEVTPVASSPFYGSWTDAEPRIIERLKHALLNANEQDQSMWNLRMSLLGKPGGLESGMVQLYTPDRLWRPDGAPITMSDILANVDDRSIIQANEGLVQQFIDSLNNDPLRQRQLLMADPGLAQELNTAAARMRGATPDPKSLRVVPMDRGVLDGRARGSDQGGWLRPLAKDPADRRIEVAGWDVDSAVIKNRVRPIDPSIEEKAQEWATNLAKKMRQQMTRGTREDLVARQFGKADGTSRSLVFRKTAGGQLVPVPPDEVLEDGAYFTRKGKRVDFGDTDYFTSKEVRLDPSGDVMHEMLGPMMEDMFDDMSNFPRLVPKGDDVTRVFRSNVLHVRDAGRSLPNFATTEMLAHSNDTWWDRFVQFGFDRVIGPSIDAVVRKPMGFHYFQQRFVQTEDWLESFADPGLKAGLQDVVDRFKPVDAATQKKVHDLVRKIAQHDGHVEASAWNAAQVESFVRGFGREEFIAMVNRAGNGKNREAAKAAKTLFQLHDRNATTAIRMAHNASVDDFVARLEAAIPEGMWVDRRSLQKYARSQLGEVKVKGVGRQARDEFESGGKYVLMGPADKETGVRTAVTGEMLTGEMARNRKLPRGHTWKVVEPPAYATPELDRIGMNAQDISTGVQGDQRVVKMGADGRPVGRSQPRYYQDPESERLVDLLMEKPDEFMAVPLVKLPDAPPVDVVKKKAGEEVVVQPLSNEELAEWQIRQDLRDGVDPIMAAVLDDGVADLLLARRREQRWIRKSAGEHAATAAVADIIPYIDSHEFRSQFAEVGKGFLPFWYAEENFLKRWGRTLQSQGPAVIRKAQLGYMGLKHAGVIREDESGKDWFVYPGSGLLADAVAKIPGLNVLPVEMMFQSPTDSILPGMSTKFGTPAFSPLVSIPMTILTAAVPELEPMKRELLGDYAAGRNALEQLVPAWLVNTYDAIRLNDGNARYASAQLSAIAQLEANGMGLSDNATPEEQDVYLDRVRNHARVILLAQALSGFFTPGPASQFYVEQETLLGMGAVDVASQFSTEYQTLIRNMGVEDGTAAYLAAHPDTDVTALMAYTVGKTESVSGAPMMPTEESLDFYSQHEDYFNEFSSAAPWLLPQGGTETRSAYAYDQQLTNELRRRRSPEEFLRAVKFKGAASMYFEVKDEYEKRLDIFKAAGKTEESKRLSDRWDIFSTGYKAAHPLFAQALNNTGAQAERERTIEEMRTVVNDSGAPSSPILEPMKQLMSVWDAYLVRKSVLSEDTTAKGRARLEQFKANVETGLNAYVGQNPSLRSFWLSVLRPEAGFD